MSYGSGEYFYERNKYGAFSIYEHKGLIRHLSQLFETGEMWGVGRWTLDRTTRRFLPHLFEEIFIKTLDSYLKFSETLKLYLPVRLIAGAVDVQGFCMEFEHDGFSAKIVKEQLIKEMMIDDYDTPPRSILIPFFEYVWEECGLNRPEDKKPLG